MESAVKYLLILFLSVFAFCGYAQDDICMKLPNNALIGDFTINNGIETGCAPFTVNVQDISGANNVKYVYEYKGEGVNYLLGTSSKINTYQTPGEYTILQYGEKDGKAIYACKTVIVKKSLDISYSLCNIGLDNKGQISIQASDSKINQQFDLFYKLGNTPPTPITTLPYSNTSIDIDLNRTATLEVYSQKNGQMFCNEIHPIAQGNLNPFKVEISKLELKANNALITVKGVYDDSYRIYTNEYPKDIYSGLRNDIQNINPGILSIQIDNPDKNNCFFIERENIGCGGRERSSIICTQFIEEIKPISPNQNHIFWNEQPPLQDPNIVRKSSSIIQIITGGNEIIQNPNGTLNHKHTLQNCKEKVCYRVITSIQDYGRSLVGNHSAEVLSDIKCIDRKEFALSPLTELYTTFDSDKIKVIFNNIEAEYPQEFHLYQLQNLTYAPVTTLNATHTAFTINPNGDNPECFKIRYSDVCESLSELSPEVCTIHLKNDFINLQWNNNNPFSNTNIQNYKIYRIEPTYDLITNLTSNFKDYLLDINEEEKYQIVGIDENGRESLSNIVSVSPKYTANFPSAFTPNSDNINDILKIEGNRNAITQLKCILTDRWNNQLLHFSDPMFEWNGKINGSKILQGTYIINCNGSFKNDEKFTINKLLIILD